MAGGCPRGRVRSGRPRRRGRARGTPSAALCVLCVSAVSFQRRDAKSAEERGGGRRSRQRLDCGGKSDATPLFRRARRLDVSRAGASKRVGAERGWLEVACRFVEVEQGRVVAALKLVEVVQGFVAAVQRFVEATLSLVGSKQSFVEAPARFVVLCPSFVIVCPGFVGEGLGSAAGAPGFEAVRRRFALGLKGFEARLYPLDRAETVSPCFGSAQRRR